MQYLWKLRCVWKRRAISTYIQCKSFIINLWRSDELMSVLASTVRIRGPPRMTRISDTTITGLAGQVLSQPPSFTWVWCHLMATMAEGSKMLSIRHTHPDTFQRLPRALWLFLSAPSPPGLWRHCIPSFVPLLLCSSSKPCSTLPERTQNLRAQR